MNYILNQVESRSTKIEMLLWIIKSAPEKRFLFVLPSRKMCSFSSENIKKLEWFFLPFSSAP